MLPVRENQMKETGEFVSKPTATTAADMRSQKRPGVAREYKTFSLNAVQCVLLTRGVIGCRLCLLVKCRRSRHDRRIENVRSGWS